MHKEYKVEMFKKGRWTILRQPWGILPAGETKTLADARKRIVETRKLWEDFNNRFGGKYNDTVPTKYRVLSREVTEWKTEE